MGRVKVVKFSAHALGAGDEQRAVRLETFTGQVVQSVARSERVTPDPPLNPFPLLRALGFPEVDSAAPVSGGADTTIWRVERDGVSYALRVFRPERAAACERELAAMEAAGAAAIPVPAIHARGFWNDRPALLLSWCPGRPVLQLLLSRPWDAASLGHLFGRMHAAIHDVPAPAAFLQHDRSWLNMLPPGEITLHKRLQRPDIRRDALLHLDYHPLNVMADHDGITGVLDWTNARAGDPRADIARTKTILRLDMGRPGRSRFANAGREAVWRVFERGWWRGYREVTSVGDDLAPFYAAAGVIMERDLGRRYTLHQLRHVRRWSEHWKRAAG